MLQDEYDSVDSSNEFTDGLIPSKLLDFTGEVEDQPGCCISFWIEEQKAHPYSLGNQRLDQFVYYSRNAQQDCSWIPHFGINVYAGGERNQIGVKKLQ